MSRIAKIGMKIKKAGEVNGNMKVGIAMNIVDTEMGSFVTTNCDFVIKGGKILDVEGTVELPVLARNVAKITGEVKLVENSVKVVPTVD